MKSGAISGWTDEDQLQIWGSHSSSINNHLQYLLLVYDGNVNIVSECHSKQVNVATWCLVNQTWVVSWWVHPPHLISIRSAVCQPMRETVPQIRVRETVGIQRSKVSSTTGMWSQIMSLLTKFELNPISSLFVNARKRQDQSKARKRKKFSEVWPKFPQAWIIPSWIC